MRITIQFVETKRSIDDIKGYAKWYRGIAEE